MLGIAAVWFSFPSVFVIGGVGFTLIVSDLLEGRRKEAAGWVTATALCGLSFAVGYLLSFRYYAKNNYLTNFWMHTLARSPRSIGDLKWYIDNFLFFSLSSSDSESRACAAFVAIRSL